MPISSPSRQKRPLVYLCVGLILLLGSAFWYWRSIVMPSKPSDAPPAKVVEIAVVHPADIQQTVQFIGTIKSEKATTLTSRATGVLDRLAEFGQKVHKGQLIAKIENKDVERNFKLAKEAEQIAKTQYESILPLLTSGYISKNAVAEKKNTWIEAQKRASDAKLARDDINITAPFDGIVGLFKIREGSQVTQGDPLVNFHDPSSLIVTFDVPLSLVNRINDNAQVIVDNKPYTLTHLQRMLDEETHMSPAYVNIDCATCIVGSAVDVTLVIQQKKAVIVVPYEATFLREGKTFVYLVKEDKAVLAPVILGLREKDRVEVIEGLKVGDKLIIRGHARLFPGISVKTTAKS